MLQNLKYLIVSSSISLASIYGYCHYTAEKNKKQYLKAINSDTLKDASRLSNESFGISWGFQADDTVMNSIDSGDLFFIKYQCIECLDPFQMLKCFRLTIPLLDEQYHTVGIAYRDQTGLMSYFNQFGENKLIKYSQFVSLPYVKQLMMQKTSNNIHTKLLKLLQDDNAFNQVQDNQDVSNIVKQTSSLNSTKQLIPQNKHTIPNQIKNFINPKQQTFTFVNRVLRKIGFLEQIDDDVTDIRQLLRNQKQVNIRTQTNKTLRSL